MLPWRRGTRPMMERKVVVLPAPLRPSSVTTSPSWTSSVTPCSTWLSPCQASRSRISSLRGRIAGSFGAEIGGDDLGVAAHRGVVALGQYAPADQHGDGVAEPLHDLEVVL